MARNTTITAGAGAEADYKAIVRTALGHIDRVRCLLAMLSDITASAEEIHMTDEAVFGFKQALLDTVDGLQDARETLERIAYTPPKLDRARAGAD